MPKIKKAKKTILIVEDEPDVQKIYKDIFRKKGYKILSADSGVKGLNLAIQKKPDLILLDIILPLKEGFEVLADLKRNKETAAIPVVILSNLEQEYEMSMAEALGAVRYLVKSDVTPKEVVKVVEEILGK
jgi:DNA-binding response OmpR family regulator